MAPAANLDRVFAAEKCPSLHVEVLAANLDEVLTGAGYGDRLAEPWDNVDEVMTDRRGVKINGCVIAQTSTPSLHVQNRSLPV